ncbi:CPBP family intramembrane glutamic endopeptidase [Paenibacillus sp. CAU 1782]
MDRQLINAGEWRKYWLAALLLTAVFMVIEIYPLVKSVSNHPYQNKVISKAEAANAAIEFATQETGLSFEASHVVHQTKKLFNGYLSKEKLLEQYETEYGTRYPGDTFQVNLDQTNGKAYGFVYVHMYTGEIAAWKFNISKNEPLNDKAAVLSALNKALQSRDIDPGKLTPAGKDTWQVEGAFIGDASLFIKAVAQENNGTISLVEFKPEFNVPQTYSSYVAKQDNLAKWMTGIGYVFFSIVLGILAIIYSILYRKHTSFKYGILLTIVFFIAYLIMNLNMLDGGYAVSGETRMPQGFGMVTVFLTILLAIPMVGSVYVSIVGGDGLWKSQGRDLWPRPSAPGFGDHVWRSVWLSYLFALGMLGLQPLLFKGLELIIGTWSTTDVMMSPYNMGVLWLMPVLAWAAAISEEAVFRFFGIGLLRKWFRHTFAATIIPTIIWSLGHVMYPFYPSTTRLFELMIIGLLFSFIFVRYGFITAVFTHAIFNSIAVASSLYLIGSIVDIVSATFFIVLPVIIAWVLREWNKRAQRKGPPVIAPNEYAGGPQAPQ